ncbi:MAG: hypothetical protein K9W43_13220 [Candidatus Thorarchaeota archaeon]|nr:hypothetical protein [Candidatus Thorarchaeota archaeon]
MIPAAIKLREQVDIGENVTLDLTLKMSDPSGDIEYVATYHWGATEIESSTNPSSKIKWISRSSQAMVQSSGDLTTAVKNIFSSMSIETDSFSLNQQGDWSLFIQKKLCEGVFINLDAEGDNTTINSLTPSLSIEFVPATLSSALDSVDIDHIKVIVTISLHIMGEVVEQYFRNCFEVFMGYVELASNVVNHQIGTIYASR